MEAKLVAKPSIEGRFANNSRSVTGINSWAGQSRLAGFFMRLLALIALPFEVYLRRDFGERWFTSLNYFAGLFYLTIFFGIQMLILILRMYLSNAYSGILSFLHFLHLSDYDPPKNQTIGDLFTMHVDYNPYLTMNPLDMVMFLTAFAVIGQYHLYKIRWRLQAGIPLHSFDDGTSRLQPLANWLAKILNVLAVPIMWLVYMLVPGEQRQNHKAPKLINDNVNFANTIVEPAFIIFLAQSFAGVLFLWFVISALALKVQAHVKEIARRQKRLDFQDGKVEAEMMRQLRQAPQQLPPEPKKGSKAAAIAKAKEAAKNAVVNDIKVEDQKFNYFSVSKIINDLEAEKRTAAEFKAESQKRILIARLIGGLAQSKHVD